MFNVTWLSLCAYWTGKVSCQSVPGTVCRSLRLKCLQKLDVLVYHRLLGNRNLGDLASSSVQVLGGFQRTILVKFWIEDELLTREGTLWSLCPKIMRSCSDCQHSLGSWWHVWGFNTAHKMWPVFSLVNCWTRGPVCFKAGSGWFFCTVILSGWSMSWLFPEATCCRRVNPACSGSWAVSEVCVYMNVMVPILPPDFCNCVLESCI